MTKLCDLSRLSFVFKNSDDIFNAYEKLNSLKEFKIIRIKNKFKYPTPAGYSDINMNIEWNNGAIKHIFEVQIHLETIIYTKSNICHQYYEGT